MPEVPTPFSTPAVTCSTSVWNRAAVSSSRLRANFDRVVHQRVESFGRGADAVLEAVGGLADHALEQHGGFAEARIGGVEQLRRRGPERAGCGFRAGRSHPRWCRSGGRAVRLMSARGGPGRFATAVVDARSRCPTEELSRLELMSPVARAIAISARAADSVTRCADSRFCWSSAARICWADSPTRELAAAVRSSMVKRMRLAVSSTRWLTRPACSSRRAKTPPAESSSLEMMRSAREPISTMRRPVVSSMRPDMPVLMEPSSDEEFARRLVEVGRGTGRPPR